MKRKFFVFVLMVVLVTGAMTVSAAYLDPNRPPEPSDKPSMIFPSTDSAVKIVCGYGCSNTHTDNPAKTIKTYYAIDLAKIGSDGFPVSFDIIAPAAGTVHLYTGYTYLLGIPQEGCPVDADPEKDGVQGMGLFLDHGNGWQSFYFHMGSVSVVEGQEVVAGTLLGTAGCTGANTIHLHFDLRHFDDATEIWWTYPVDFVTLTTGLRIDLALAIDTTGSMYDDIASVKLAASDIVDIVFDAAPDSRVALLDFRDFPSRTGASYDYPYRDALPFTQDTALAKNAINALTLGYGGDTPETLFCALTHAIDANNCLGYGANTSIGPWRPIAEKFIVYLTDAPALNPEPYTNYTMFTLLNVSAEGGFEILGGEDDPSGYPDDPYIPYGIRIYPVVVGGNTDALLDAYEIAEGTGGEVFTAADASEVAGAIIDAIQAILVKDVIIDIKPNNPSNNISCSNPNVVIPVAILSTETFDATTVDHTTVTFEGASDRMYDRQTGDPTRREEDVNGDGLIDLLFEYRFGDTLLTCDSTFGTLLGQTYDGTQIQGVDSVNIRP